MIYTLKRDDMPLLSQWINKNRTFVYRQMFCFCWCGRKDLILDATPQKPPYYAPFAMYLGPVGSDSPPDCHSTPTVQVLFVISPQNRTAPCKKHDAVRFGRGIGIRTPTNRVRVCRATVTQFLYMKCQPR